MREAREAGDPIGFVVLDSLSRLKPPEVDENDNDGLTAWLDALEAIAFEEGAHIILIHHQGHSRQGRKTPAQSAPRGASAIAAVVAVLLVLDKPAKKRRRSVRVEGNFLTGSETTFEVAPESAEASEILYFRPVDPLAAHDPEMLLGPEGEISTNGLAWKLSGKERQPGKNPPGAATTLAGELRKSWKAKGLVTVEKGPRNALMIKLVPHLSTAPDSQLGEVTKTGNSTSPTAPIEARFGGEERTDSRPTASGEASDPPLEPTE